jgi:hypothetical protein
MLKAFKNKNKAKLEANKHDRGILVFENTSEVIKAENALKSEGLDIKVMGPPPDLRSGCDLVIEFPLIIELEILRILSAVDLKPLQAVPVTSILLEPVDLLHIRDYGKYLMVRAANMKITVDKDSLIIVNVSGGGCPDVPYLAEKMVNKHLSDAPNPKEFGFTLCAYALQIAYDRMVALCSV